MSVGEADFTPGKSERSSILDSYSSQLAIRDQALDRRDYLLKKREKEVESKWEACKQEARELELIRSSIYHEKSAFRLASAKRDNDLKDAEKTQSSMENELSSRLEVVNELLETSKSTASELREKREELKRVNERLAYMHSTLRTAKKTVSDLTSKSEETLTRERKIAEAAAALDARERELKSIEGNLVVLESELWKRERSLSERLAEADAVLPLKRILPDLRKVAGEYRDFRRGVMRQGETSGVSDEDEPPQNVEDEARLLCAFFGDLRSFVRAVAARENACATKEELLSERTRSLAASEQSLSSRERSAREAERNVSTRLAEADLQTTEAKALLLRSEENTARVAEAERRLQVQETSLQERENLLHDKEAHLSRQRTLLEAQEKSLERAGEAVKKHEAAIDAEVSKIEEMRAKAEGAQNEIRARESAFKTKEVEISAREAAVNVATRRARLERPRGAVGCGRRLGDAGADEGADEGATTEAVTAGVASGNLSDGGEEPTGVAHASEPAPPQVTTTIENVDAEASVHPDVVPKTQTTAASQLPATVRKQLTFGGHTPRNPLPTSLPPQPVVPRSENASEAISRASDAESDQAAGQLHEELRAARGIWIEKVNRLDSVVSSMSVDLTTTGAQLLPVIRGVRDELARIRSEAMQEGDEEEESHARAAFETERRRQREWGVVLSAQLNTINEVQAGLLHAFNRVLPNSRVQMDAESFYSERRRVRTTTSPQVELPVMERREALRLTETEADSANGSRPGSEESAADARRAVPGAKRKARRKHRKGLRQPGGHRAERSMTDDSNEQNAFALAVAGSKKFPYRPPRPPLMPLSDIDHLDAIRKELGLDPVPPGPTP